MDEFILTKMGVTVPTREFVSTVYIVKEKRVLLVWNKKAASFVPIGGHVDKNELPCDSVIREAKEESGFDIKIIGGKDVGREIISASGSKRVYIPQNFAIGLDVIKPDHHHINLIYIGKIEGGIQLARSDEGDELRWFSKEELKAEPNLLENVKEEGMKVLDFIEKY